MSFKRKRIKLIASDGKVFKISRINASLSNTLRFRLVDANVVKLPEVNSRTLARIVEWMEFWEAEITVRLEEPFCDDPFNRVFLNSLSQDALMELVLRFCLWVEIYHLFKKSLFSFRLLQQSTWKSQLYSHSSRLLKITWLRIDHADFISEVVYAVVAWAAHTWLLYTVASLPFFASQNANNSSVRAQMWRHEDSSQVKVNYQGHVTEKLVIYGRGLDTLNILQQHFTTLNLLGMVRHIIL